MAHVRRGRAVLLKRVRRLKGQVEAIERALAGEPDCGAVLQQLAAVRGAVNSLMAEVLEGHVLEHLGGSAADLDPVLHVIRRYLR